jgi:hypothetical protein
MIQIHNLIMLYLSVEYIFKVSISCIACIAGIAGNTHYYFQVITILSFPNVPLVFI